VDTRTEAFEVVSYQETGVRSTGSRMDAMGCLEMLPKSSVGSVATYFDIV
jgi:hypothetical protein